MPSKLITLFLVEAVSHLELTSSLALLAHVGVVLALLATRTVYLEHVLACALSRTVGLSACLLHLLVRLLTRHRHVYVLNQLSLAVLSTASLVLVPLLRHLGTASEVSERYLIHVA